MDKPENAVEIDLTEPVSLTFSLKYLTNFCKASGLSDTVKLCLSSEVPLLVEYGLANNSYLRFYLAPKVCHMCRFVSKAMTNVDRSATRSNCVTTYVGTSNMFPRIMWGIIGAMLLTCIHSVSYLACRLSVLDQRKRCIRRCSAQRSQKQGYRGPAPPYFFASSLAELQIRKSTQYTTSLSRLVCSCFTHFLLCILIAASFNATWLQTRSYQTHESSQSRAM